MIQIDKQSEEHTRVVYSWWHRNIGKVDTQIDLVTTPRHNVEQLEIAINGVMVAIVTREGVFARVPQYGTPDEKMPLQE